MNPALRVMTLLVLSSAYGLAGAAWPEQHADAWLLLCDERLADFDAWLASCRDEGAKRGCDTLLLSSENFQVPRTRPALKRIMANWQRQTGGETRLIYVRRELVAGVDTATPMVPVGVKAQLIGLGGVNAFEANFGRANHQRVAVDNPRHARQIGSLGQRAA